MTMYAIKQDLITLLRQNRIRNRLVLHRGETEMDRLVGWACRADQALSRNRLDELRRMIEQCNACSGAAEKKFGIGAGANRVMVILNAPQLVNAVEKKLMKKESVELLKKIIQAAGLSFADCYITNLVKCDINDPLMKPSQIAANCEAVIGMEIDVMKPRIAVVFGDIIPLQKTVKESTDVFWFNIDHPITIIKNPEIKRKAWNTVKLIMGKMRELGLS